MDIVITIEYVICLGLALGILRFLVMRVRSRFERGWRKRI